MGSKKFRFHNLKILLLKRCHIISEMPFTCNYFLVPLCIVRHGRCSFFSCFFHRLCKIFCVWFREFVTVPIAATNTYSHHYQQEFDIHDAIQGPMECLTNYRTHYRTLEEIKALFEILAYIWISKYFINQSTIKKYIEMFNTFLSINYLLSADYV